jgi:Fe-Mn family superoxide dismutase
MEYQARSFSLPAQLEGISPKSVEEHLGLYQGYVKNFNAVTALAGELMKDSEKNAHAISELMRRRSFEFGGMRLHEHYFAQWEEGARVLDTNSALGGALARQYGNIDYCLQEVRQVGMMRGPGWSLLYFDKEAGQFLVGFSGEQHQGHFVTLPIVLALDVWEHAYLLDYGAQGKGKYIDAFFKNLNWGVIEKRFDALV